MLSVSKRREEDATLLTPSSDQLFEPAIHFFGKNTPGRPVQTHFHPKKDTQFYMAAISFSDQSSLSTQNSIHKMQSRNLHAFQASFCQRNSEHEKVETVVKY